MDGLTATINEIDLKINEFAVLPSATAETTKGQKSTPKLLSDLEPSDELREIERELECPVCMEIAKPPIYQCEEGHIICCHCKVKSYYIFEKSILAESMWYDGIKRITL